MKMDTFADLYKHEPTTIFFWKYIIVQYIKPFFYFLK